MPRVWKPQSKEYGKQYREKNRDILRQKARAHYEKALAQIAAIKLEAGCMDCGYAEHSAALDFDHRPGEVKSGQVGTLAGRKWEVVQTEIDKCDVVCSNCHRIRTFNRNREARDKC